MREGAIVASHCFPCVMSPDQFKTEVLTATNEPWRLSRVVVRGDLDLRFLRIQRPVEAERIVFEGTVDFRNARFASTLCLSRCQFRGRFNCGDRDLSHTHFEQDLVLNRSIFLKEAWFVGVRCEGSVSLNRCRFLGPATVNIQTPRSVDFNGAHVSKELSVTHAVIRGNTSFNAVRCDIGAFFTRTRFDFSDPMQPADFIAGRYGMALEFGGASFSGGAIFEGVTCGLSLFLDCVRFKATDQLVSLSYVTAPYIWCRGADFAGPVNFIGLRCANEANFHRVEFDADIEWSDLSVGAVPVALRSLLQRLNLVVPAGSVLHREGEVWRIVSGEWNSGFFLRQSGSGSTFVLPTRFSGATTEFSHSSFGWNLILNGVVFNTKLICNGVRCDGGAFLSNAECLSHQVVDFSFSYIGVNLQLSEAVFRGFVDLEATSIRGNLIATDASFERGVDLSSTRMRRLVIGRAVPFKGSNTRFRGCAIEGLEAPTVPVAHHGHWQWWRRPGKREPWQALVESQDPAFFSRDIYLTLERSFRASGTQKTADAIHYAGRCAERDAARRDASGVDWSWVDWSKDSASKWLTGSGVRLGRLLGWIALFVGLGAVVFWPDRALTFSDPKSAVPAVAASAAPVGVIGGTPLPPSSSGGARSTQPAARRPGRAQAFLTRASGRIGYSFDKFLPVISLDLDRTWVVRGGWRRAYLALHITAGWILMPLLIAGVTGLLKRQGSD